MDIDSSYVPHGHLDYAQTEHNHEHEHPEHLETLRRLETRLDTIESRLDNLVTQGAADVGAVGETASDVIEVPLAAVEPDKPEEKRKRKYGRFR